MNAYIHMARRSFTKQKRAWIILGICLLLALKVFWPLAKEPPAKEPPALLLVIGGLVVAVVIAYAILSLIAPRLDAALLDSHYERFRRLEGLFNAIPASIRNNRADADLSLMFESLCRKLEGWVDPQTRDFTQNDASDFVHNLNLLFLQIAPQSFLIVLLEAIRREYRDAFGFALYESHYAAAEERFKLVKNAAEMDQLLRAEAIYLLNETRRHILLEQHVESTRQRLMSAALRSWWYNVIPFFAVLIFFLFCQSCIEHAIAAGTGATDWSIELARGYLFHPHEANSLPIKGTMAFQVLTAAAMLSLIGIAGASGGMLSVIQRVQTADGNADASADLRALSQSETSVFFAPVTGVMFSIVLSAMFAGDVVKGAMFPKMESVWFLTIWQGVELAKWLVWGFLAGFSERLVPDMLNGVVKDAKDRERPVANPLPSQAKLAEVLDASRETDSTDGGEASETNPLPVLHSHTDSIPPDASEVTVTGEGFNASTELIIDGSTKHPHRLQVTANSISFKIEPPDLKDKSQIVVVAKNPPPGGGESHALTILIGEPGG